jgi:hypothetical protein
MNWILIILEMYAVGCVLLLMPLIVVNLYFNRTMLSTETVVCAIYWPIFLLAILLWLVAFLIFGNGRNRIIEEL